MRRGYQTSECRQRCEFNGFCNLHLTEAPHLAPWDLGWPEGQGPTFVDDAATAKEIHEDMLAVGGSLNLVPVERIDAGRHQPANLGKIEHCVVFMYRL